MASPFSFSGHSAYSFQSTGTSISRPPIYNPYDKFTQPEFDAWIGGITGSLRHALGLEDEIAAQSAYDSQRKDASYSDDEEQEVQEIIEEEDRSSDGSVHSFEVSEAPRVGKGKARDPRDGPGFSQGLSQMNSIFVEDSEEEVSNDEKGEAEDEGEESGEESGDSVYEEGKEDEESWEKAEHSSQLRLESQRQMVMQEEGEGEGENEQDEDGEEEEEGEEGDEDEVDEEQEESEAEDGYLEQIQRSTYRVSPRASSPVLILSSDEEIEVPPTHVSNEERAESRSHEVRIPMELPESDLRTVGSPCLLEPYQQQRHHPIITGEDGEGKKANLIDKNENSQPMENDTSFPPHNVDGPNGSAVDGPIEIRDPWIGPKTYAEDYYSGGDVREGQQGLTADRLSEWDDPEVLAAHAIGVEIQGTNVNLETREVLDESDLVAVSAEREEFVSNHTLYLSQDNFPDTELVVLDTKPASFTNEPEHPKSHEPSRGPTDIVAQQTVANEAEIQGTQTMLEAESSQAPRSQSEQFDIENIYNDIDIEGIEASQSQNVDLLDVDWGFLDRITASVEVSADEVGIGQTSPAPFDPSGTNETDDNSEPQEIFTSISEVPVSPLEIGIPVNVEPSTLKQTLSITELSSPNRKDSLSSPESDHIEDNGGTTVAHHESANIAESTDLEFLDVQTKRTEFELDSPVETAPSKSFTRDEFQQPISQEVDTLNQASPGVVSSTSLPNNIDVGPSTQRTAVETTAETSPDEVVGGDPTTLLKVASEEVNATPSGFDHEVAHSKEASLPSVFRAEPPERPLLVNDIDVLEESDHTTCLSSPPTEELPMPVSADLHIPDPINGIFSPRRFVLNHTETSEEHTPIAMTLHDGEQDSDDMQDFLLKTNPDRLFAPVPDFADLVSSFDSSATQVVAPFLAEHNILGSNDLDDKPNEALHMSHTSSADTRAPQDIDQFKDEAHYIGENFSFIAAATSAERKRSPSPKSISLPYKASPSPPPVTVAMHKTSGPILLADPYPASLSTPGSFLDSTKDSPYTPLDGDTSQESSFTVNQDSSYVRQNLKEDDYPESLDGTGLLYPTPQHKDHDQTSPLPDTAKEEVELAVVDLHEKDADGDLDSDVTTISNKELVSTSPIKLPTIQTAIDQDRTLGDKTAERDDVFRNARSTDNQTSYPATQVPEHISNTSSNQRPARSVQADDELPAILIIKKPAAAQDSRKEGAHTFVQTNEWEDPAQNVTKSKGRQPKRKRDSTTTATTSPNLAPSKQAGKQKASRPTSILRGTGDKSKGKGKETRVSPLSKGSLDTRSVSSMSSSDASSAIRLLRHSSRNGSRASSVVSNAPSDISSPIIQPSPTSVRNSGPSRYKALPLPPPPLLHKHSHNRPNIQYSPPAQTLHQSAIQKMSPSSQSFDHTPPAPATTSTSSQPTAPRRSTSFVSSPTTRSNCRYHKISIPREEDGPRVYFLVPGCSLGDAELLQKEEVLDHGTASPEDGRHMTPNLDAYAFDPYVLSVLRLLVGVDMLREQEVYYVPQLGINSVPLRTYHKQSISRASTDNASHASVTSRRDSNASAISPLSPIARTSFTESASASSAVRPFTDKDENTPSISSHSDSDITDVDELLHTKRPRLSPAEAKTTVGDMGPPTTEPRSRKMKPRRSIRLVRDNAEYKPDTDNGEDSQHEESHSGARRGTKRGRVSNINREPEGDAQKLKKQRISNDGQQA